MKSQVIAGAALLAAFGATAQQDKQDLKRKLKDTAHASWIYDDLPAAFEAAKTSGKPILAVFRCVP